MNDAATKIVDTSRGMRPPHAGESKGRNARVTRSDCRYSRVTGVWYVCVSRADALDDPDAGGPVAASCIREPRWAENESNASQRSNRRSRRVQWGLPGNRTPKRRRGSLSRKRRFT